MVKFKETRLWREAFESDLAKEHESAVNRLIAVLDKARENASVLVSEIAIDLPHYTVHSIEHLDALWEIGSQIVGPNFRLNPVEGFVLGCSFLFHDAAMTMAAYPQGYGEVKKSREWKRIAARLSQSGSGEVNEASITEAFLREQHAVRAEALPKISWTGEIGPHFLIDDAESRERFGDFIGKIAASHWWDHGRLEAELHDKKIPTPAPFPSSWSIDLLKLACVVRTADASQIDEQRAPSFLRVLRQNRLPIDSSRHWSFQSKLTQAQCRNDTLFFAALRPFSMREANEWWLLHDTLKMIDGELRKTDDLLSRLRGDPNRFMARRVANIESTKDLQSSIPTVGWRPVDTAFSISDIPRLIENLGGQQLYGNDNSAALREIVQNAMDAVRIRQVVDPSAPEPIVEVDLDRTAHSCLLTIRDNGVGMSEGAIVSNLLSFGSSGWLQDPAIGEYSENYPLKSSVSGRYGIGFFSVFMIGSSIEVKSRRFDQNPDSTIVLSFPDGLNSRPLLRSAEYQERMTAGGTELKICLNTPSLKRSILGTWRRTGFRNGEIDSFDSLVEMISVNFPTSDVPVRIRSGGQVSIVDGREWESEPVSSLLRRTEGSEYLGESGAEYEAAVSLVREDTGEVVGRAVLFPTGLDGRFHGERQVDGSVVSQGARVCQGSFRGVLKGTPVRASRDAGVLIASKVSLSKWATEQAILLEPIASRGIVQEGIAALVAGIGGNIGGLRFCEIGDTYYNVDSFRELLRNCNEIWVAQDAAISNCRPIGGNPRRAGSCVAVNFGIPAFIHANPGFMRWATDYDGRTLASLAMSIICDEFDISSEVSQKALNVENGRRVYRATVAAWNSEDGSVVNVDGFYFRRKMTLQDFDAFYFFNDGSK